MRKSTDALAGLEAVSDDIDAVDLRTTLVYRGWYAVDGVDSEELAGGLLNLISWPMMLLSGVWFSLEGSHPLIQESAKLLPLTHLLDGARAVMLDGAGMTDVAGHALALVAMSALFLGLGAVLFRWRPE